MIHSAAFRCELCAAVRADALLEVSQFMWQPFSTVIHAAVRTKKKKIWQMQFVESQRELWEEGPRRTRQRPRPAGGAEP